MPWTGGSARPPAWAAVGGRGVTSVLDTSESLLSYLLLKVFLTSKFCRGQSTVQETQRLPESEEEQRLQDRDHPLPLPPEGDPQEGGDYPGGR